MEISGAILGIRGVCEYLTLCKTAASVRYLILVTDSNYVINSIRSHYLRPNFALNQISINRDKVLELGKLVSDLKSLKVQLIVNHVRSHLGSKNIGLLLGKELEFVYNSGLDSISMAIYLAYFGQVIMLPNEYWELQLYLCHIALDESTHITSFELKLLEGRHENLELQKKFTDLTIIGHYRRIKLLELEICNISHFLKISIIEHPYLLTWERNRKADELAGQVAT